MFRPELIEADADDDEATEDMSIYRRKDDDVSVLSFFLFARIAGLLYLTLDATSHEICQDFQ